MKNKKYKLKVDIEYKGDLNIENFAVYKKYFGLFWLRVSEPFFTKILGHKKAQEKAIDIMNNYCSLVSSEFKPIKKTVECKCEK